MGSRKAVVTAAMALFALAAAQPAGAAVRLFHDSFSTAYRSPAGAVPPGTKVTLRLRVTGARPTSVTARIEAADLVAETSSVRNLKLRRRGSLWSLAYRTPAKPSVVTYSFRVRIGKRTLWYGDDNASNDATKGGTGKTTAARGDAFHLTVYARDFTTPAWLQGAVVYEIFADRFRNGDPTNDYCRAGSSSGCPTFYGDIPATLHPTWNEPVEDSRATGVFNRDFFGGDLEGVTEKLPYLKGLGVDAIWLTPIFQARSNHRYDTDDYMHVDPALGGDAAFAQLSAAARAQGIHLILDGVFNHTSSDSRYFDRYHRYPDVVGACESPSSPFRDWFSITGSDTPCTNYTGFAGLDSLPKLNHSNPAVRDFVASVTANWMHNGADGWRLDAVQEIAHRWIAALHTSVKAVNRDAPMVGEVTAGPVDATEYLLGNELDGVMNYRFRQAAIGFARMTLFTDSSGTIRPLTPAQLDHSLKAVLEDYPRQAAAVSFNLVDSHDTNRVSFALSEQGDPIKDKQRLVALLQFTTFGAPMVYYGDETGMYVPGKNGFGDPYNRVPYPWPDQGGTPDAEVVADYAQLASIRHALPALRTGLLRTLATNANVYAFARIAAPNKPVVVVLNKSAGRTDLDIPVRGFYPNGTTLRDQRSSFEATVVNGRAHVQLSSHDGVILVGTP